MTRRTLASTGTLLLLACSRAAGGPVAGPSQAVICPPGQVVGRDNRCEEARPLPPLASSSAAPPAPLTKPGVFEPLIPPDSANLEALHGRWFGEDSDGSASYELEITPFGAFTQTINTLHTNSGRSTGSCLQQGRVRVEGQTVIWVYERNSCNTEYEGQEDPDAVIEQSARHFVLDMDSYQVHYTRRR